MSRYSIHKLRELKAAGRKFAMITAYDYAGARLVEQAGAQVILVGDSLGSVVLGYDSTVPVTMDDMVHHTQGGRPGHGEGDRRRRHAVHELPGERGRGDAERRAAAPGRRARRR